MYVGGAPGERRSRTTANLYGASRAELDRIDGELERAVSEQLRLYQAKITAARATYREAVEMLKAKATLAKFALRQPAST
jgi:hypothetical protein